VEPADCLLDLLDDPKFEQELLQSVFRDIVTPERSKEPSPTGLAPVLHTTGTAGALRLRGRVRRQQQEGKSSTLSEQGGQSEEPPQTREQQDATDQRNALRGSVSCDAIPLRLRTPVTLDPIPGAQPTPSQFTSSKKEITRSRSSHVLGSHVPGSHALLPSLSQKPREGASWPRSQSSIFGTKAFERMLDENLVPTKYEMAQRSKAAERKEQGVRDDERLQSLRDMLRKADVMDRVIDLFRKFDVDKNGEVDLGEFQHAITTTLPQVQTTEVESLFVQFDSDKSGFISYNEMRDTLKSTIVKVKAFQLPLLPRDLQSRKREVLDLFKGLEAKRRNNDHVAPGINPPTFEDALRLYYPKDTKGQISILVKWVNEVMRVKAEAAEAKTREADSALIKEIDTDGNGTISLSEFVELSKRTGLSKVQMRARFREKDFGNAGQLSLDQMREVLNELRAANKLRTGVSRRAAGSDE